MISGILHYLFSTKLKRLFFEHFRSTSDKMNSKSEKRQFHLIPHEGVLAPKRTKDIVKAMEAVLNLILNPCQP